MSTIEKITKIEREQVALNLKFKGYDAHGNLIEFNELDVRFKDQLSESVLKIISKMNIVNHLIWFM